MKIGICLSGISFSTSGRIRDFRTTSNNFFETIYNPLIKNNEISIYLTTYEHEFKSELLNTYTPKKYQFLPYLNSNSRSTFMSGLCLLEDENLDVILTTRFDITFFKKITDLNIDYSKFNFLFKEKDMWKSHHFVTDNLFIFPKKFLYDFANAIEIANNDPLCKQCTFMLHNVYNPVLSIIGHDNIHFISPDIEEFSHANTFYNLNRSYK